MTSLPLFSQRLFALLVGLAVTVTPSAVFAFDASYWYRQDNINFATNQQIIYEDNVGPVPEALNAVVQTPNSMYTFDVNALPTTSTELSARASLTVTANQLGSTEGWFSAEAHALAEASLVDFGFVQGAPGVPVGEVLFHWVVGGNSQILLDTRGPNDVRVDNLSTWTVLQSTIPGSAGVLLNDFHEFPSEFSGNELFDESYPAATGAIVYPVPWEAGTEMPIFFDLTTRVDLEISNFDAAGFESTLDTDFFNTADLLGVQIVDQNGVPIPGATLVSQNGFDYNIIPEPNSLLLIFLSTLACGRSRRRSNRCP